MVAPTRRRSASLPAGGWSPPAPPPAPRAPLPREFYARGTLEVARDLLGKLLVRRLGGLRLSGAIVEVEAYVGEADTACHASRGRTPRNEVMYGPPGHAYVYFTYGMHWMLNVVTEPEGRPGAVLVRSVVPVEGIEEIRAIRAGRPDRELTSGPARLCAALRIDGKLDAADLVLGEDLRVEDFRAVPERDVATGPRIGIDYAAPKDRRAPWRFWIHSRSGTA